MKNLEVVTGNQTRSSSREEQVSAHMADLNSGVADLRSCVVILCESMRGRLEFEPSKLNGERSPPDMQIGRHGFQINGYIETDLSFKNL
jgi:hypothetical protein